MDVTIKMPLLIFRPEPPKDRVITMGKADEPVADYYPPGATEPIVRPAHIPAPVPVVEEVVNVEEEAEKNGVITGDEKKEAPTEKKSAKAPAKKK